MIKLTALLTSLSAILGYTNTYIPKSYYPKSALIMEVDSGEILYEENMDLPVEIASVSKLMTAYTVLDEVEKGNIALEDKLTVTKDIVDIANIPETSSNLMVLNNTYTLNDVLYLTLLSSSNAATVLLANRISGNESDFVLKMNEHAKRLNMNNTVFVNSSGLENELLSEYTNNHLTGENISTAYDMASFVRDLVTRFPQIINYTKTKEITITTNIVETIYSTYIPFLKDNDENVGLKSGTGEKIGYNFVGLANHNGKKYVVMVFGAGVYLSDPSVRYTLASALMSYAKEAKVETTVLNKGEHHIDCYDVYLDEDFTVLSNHNPSNIMVSDNQIVFKQKGQYLDKTHNIVNKPIQILRMYEYNRRPFAYFGLELCLIGLLAVKKSRQKRQYKF